MIHVYTAMAEIIKPLLSFVKIDLNIQSEWSLFTENKHNMLLLSMICQHNSQSIMKIIYNRTILCLFGFTQTIIVVQ